MVAKEGFALLASSGSNPQLHYISKPIPESQRPYTRFNDGACDRKGRFVAGTLHHGKEPKFGGTLYSYDPRTGETKVLDDSGITVNLPHYMGRISH